MIETPEKTWPCIGFQSTSSNWNFQFEIAASKHRPLKVTAILTWLVWHQEVRGHRCVIHLETFSNPVHTVPRRCTPTTMQRHPELTTNTHMRNKIHMCTTHIDHSECTSFIHLSVLPDCCTVRLRYKKIWISHCTEHAEIFPIRCGTHIV